MKTKLTPGERAKKLQKEIGRFVNETEEKIGEISSSFGEQLQGFLTRLSALELNEEEPVVVEAATAKTTAKKSFFRTAGRGVARIVVWPFVAVGRAAIAVAHATTAAWNWAFSRRELVPQAA